MSDVAFSGLPRILNIDGTEKIPLDSNDGVTSYILSGLLYYPKLYNNISGFNIINNGTAKLDISAGYCFDSTFALYFNFLGLTQCICQAAGAWAAGANANKLDAGAIGASLPYYIFAIRKDSDASIDILFSLSSTAPTMPAGYTYKRLIGAFLTNGSTQIISCTWSRKGTSTLICKYTSFILDRASAAFANTNRILITVSAPPTALLFSCWSFTPSAALFCNLGETSDTDSAPSTVDNSKFYFNTNIIASIQTRYRVDSNRQLYIRSNTTSATCALKNEKWELDL